MDQWGSTDAKTNDASSFGWLGWTSHPSAALWLGREMRRRGRRPSKARGVRRHGFTPGRPSPQLFMQGEEACYVGRTKGGIVWPQWLTQSKGRRSLGDRMGKTGGVIRIAISGGAQV